MSGPVTLSTDLHGLPQAFGLSTLVSSIVVRWWDSGMNEYCGWAKLGRDINVSIQRGAVRVGPGVL